MSHDIRMTIEIAAERDRVFEALTARDDLRAWFADEAEVTPEMKRYDFGGRHIPGAPERDATHHDLLTDDPPSRLAYDWTLRGGESRVSFALAKAKKGTTLELHHALARGRTAREGAMSDFWGAALERLKAWVEHRHRGYFPDYSKPPTKDLKMSVDIEASAADIFRALTEPSRVERWLATPGKSTIDERVGGHYNIGWDDGGPKTILAFEPGKRLAYSWSYKSEPDTVAVWTMEPAGPATRLTLTHSGFDDATRYEPYLMGWGFFLNRVKLLLELDQGRSAVSKEDDYEEVAA